MEEMAELAEVSLELLILGEAEHPLGKSISMFIE